MSKSITSTEIGVIRHKDKRTNIPTEELRDFMAEEEKNSTTTLYPRDPSLDPQLVWKGKDKQDAMNLEMLNLPVYIQEKIHPQAIIDNLRAQSKRKGAEQLQFFDDFNGIEEFEQKVDFYHHDQKWTNRMILGDSLLVMNSLAEREGLKGKMQMIYIDPPYGIKFGSNWQVSTRKRDVKDGKAEDATRQPEQIKAFRDTWELGIHSYLSYLRDRLVVARELLTESGSVFVQIGDENVHLVRCLLDEVFGAENYVGQINFQKTGGLVTEGLIKTVDYILWYSKERPLLKSRILYAYRKPGEKSLDRYDLGENSDGTIFRLSLDQSMNETNDNMRRLQLAPLYSGGGQTNPPILKFNGHNYSIRPECNWKTTETGLYRLAKASRIMVQGSMIRFKRYSDDFPVIPITDRWDSVQIGTERQYVVQTANKVIERCILMSTDPGDLVLDPTCGSGTTAYVAEEWGRRWITIDTSRVALTLARTRLMAAKYPYYLLLDSPAGVAKEAELTGKFPSTEKTGDDIRKGFVFKRVPHVQLKSIANNQEIDEIYARWQEKMEPLRAEINCILKKNFEEWELPREADKTWSKQVARLLQQWWELRHSRQEEIDTSIARHADTELLYDQPYEDNKRIRVTGPFTVESLSPYRAISTDPKQPATEQETAGEAGNQFETMILDNLRKAGVQNTKKGERLKFDRLEPYPGACIQAVGEYTDEQEMSRQVAVSIGPENGTVGPNQIKEAAKEAVQGVGFNLLLVCGFAFDPHVSEEVKRYGRLTVLPVRMNMDLTMGDAVLKKTGAGNLFMVFGEPDIDLIKEKDGKIVVQLNGLDIYDPNTGAIRSSTVDDIACWFIDTDYNGESFFVRHAYFTGGDQPYEKLQRALHAEVDETAWHRLHSNRSFPFEPPSTGRIAVKVINHYGDEVLKVYQV